MTDSDQVLLCAVDEHGIASLTLNRPDVRNALNGELICSLSSQLRELARDKDVRLITLEGNGDTFCSGADANWMVQSRAAEEQQSHRDTNDLAELFRTLRDLKNKPTVALVHGAAFGGGVGLIACCDTAIASEDAYFCFPEVHLGIAPATIAPHIIDAIGPRQTRRLFISGERIGALEARSIGLIHHAVPPEDFATRRRVVLNNLLKGSPTAQLLSTMLVETAAELSQSSLDTFTSDLIAKLRASNDGQEGIRSFLQKRPPNWAKQID